MKAMATRNKPQSQLNYWLIEAAMILIVGGCLGGILTLILTGLSDTI